MISLGQDYTRGSPEWELQAGLRDIESASKEGTNRNNLLKSAQEHLKKGYAAFSKAHSIDAYRMAGLLLYKIEACKGEELKISKFFKPELAALKIFGRLSKNGNLVHAVDAIGKKGKQQLLALEDELGHAYGRYFLDGNEVDLTRFQELHKQIYDDYRAVDVDKLPKDVRNAFLLFKRQLDSLEGSFKYLEELTERSPVGLDEDIKVMKHEPLVELYRTLVNSSRTEQAPLLKEKIGERLVLVKRELEVRGIDPDRALSNLPMEAIVAKVQSPSIYTSGDWKGDDPVKAKAAVDEFFTLYTRSDDEAKKVLKPLLEEIIEQSTLSPLDLETVKLKTGLHENYLTDPNQAILRRTTDDTPGYLDKLIKNEGLQEGFTHSSKPESFQFEGMVVAKVRDYLMPIKGERQADALGRIKNIESKLPALEQLANGSGPSAKAFKNIYDQIMGHVEDAKEMQIRIAVDDAKKIGSLFVQPDPTEPAMRPTSLKNDLETISAIVEAFARSREKANAPALDLLEADAKALYEKLAPVFALDRLGVGELKTKLEQEMDKQQEARFNLLVKEKDEALAINPFSEKKLNAVVGALRKFNSGLASNSSLKSRVNATLEGTESEKQFVNSPKDPGEYIAWLEGKASVLEGRGVPEALKAKVAKQLYAALEGFGPEAMTIVDKHPNIEKFIEKSESPDLVDFKKYRKAVKELATSNFPESKFDPETFLTKVRQGHYGTAASVPVARMGQFMDKLKPIMLGRVGRQLSTEEGLKLAELTKAWVKLDNHYKGMLEKASKDPNFSADDFMKSDDYLKFLIQVAQVKLLNAEGKFYPLATIFADFSEEQIDAFFTDRQHEERARQELVQTFT